MPEFFIAAQTFAAPFFSDSIETYVTANDARAAVMALRLHSVPIYAANVYASADDYHKNGEPLERWRCNKELTLQRAKDEAGTSAWSIYSKNHNTVEVNGKEYAVEQPYDGAFV